jgi:hypothetical protein
VNLHLAPFDETLDEIAQTEFVEIDGGSCVGHVLRPAIRAASLQLSLYASSNPAVLLAKRQVRNPLLARR